IEALTDMHRRKTGALIMAAVKTGALIAGADERKLSALTGYARASSKRLTAGRCSSTSSASCPSTHR
ncbi:MAG TPA: hypothetical protein PKN52_07450, partial [Trueperaceae bacterium]|nr:hypothetical protein [Trueperaceae bacterium]